MNQVLRIAVSASLVAGALGAHAAAFQNGSFELNTGSLTSSSRLGLDPGNLEILGWEVFGDIIDLHSVTDTGIPASNGKYSLDFGSGHQYLNFATDLTRSSNGGIRQTFDTVASQQYRVTFEFGGFRDDFGGPGEAIKDMRVSADGQQQDYAFNTVGLPSFVGWSTQSFAFTANDASATLSFSSLDQDLPAGVYLDNVRVEAVPEPATMAALGLGVAALLKRRKK